MKGFYVLKVNKKREYEKIVAEGEGRENEREREREKKRIKGRRRRTVPFLSKEDKKWLTPFCPGWPPFFGMDSFSFSLICLISKSTQMTRSFANATKKIKEKRESSRCCRSWLSEWRGRGKGIMRMPRCLGSCPVQINPDDKKKKMTDLCHHGPTRLCSLALENYNVVRKNFMFFVFLAVNTPLLCTYASFLACVNKTLY